MKNRALTADLSFSGIMTSQLVIRESEWPRPVDSSILISQMTRSLVIILYMYITWLTFLTEAFVTDVTAEGFDRSRSTLDLTLHRPASLTTLPI